MRIQAPLAMAALAMALALAAHAAEPDAQPNTDAWLRAAVHLDHEALARGQAFRAAVVLVLDDSFHVNANPPSLEFQIPTKVEPAPQNGIAWGKVRYPTGEPLAADWAGDQTVRAYSGRTILVVPGTVAGDAPLGPATLTVTLAYQGCDASTCYAPGQRTLTVETEIVGADATPARANADVFASAPQLAPDGSRRGDALGTPLTSPRREPGGTPVVRFEGESNVAAWFERGLAIYFGLLLVGGLALNLTPCVFPLIPITMNVFAQQGESRPLKVLPLAITYALGLALTFTVVGVLAALAGRSLGLVLQNPWGVLGVVTVLAAMMASAFGAFDMNLPPSLLGKLGGRQGFLGAAFMGMVMGVIAAPCVGPFLIALIAFIATTRSVVLGAASFFVTGLGLGLPYIVLGTFTGLVNRFPRSGGWLVWTKRLMAMALAGLILHFIRPYVAPAFFWPLVLVLFVFAAVYVGLIEGLARRPFSKTFWTVRIAVAVALLAAGIAVYATWAPEATAAPDDPAVMGDSAANHGPHVEWTPWQPDALAQAKDAGRGVLVYFGADWCTECRAWKATIFSDPAVVAASETLTRLYVDLTEKPVGAKAAFADTYRGRNPPAVLIFDARGRFLKGWNDPPDVDTFVETLRQAAGATPSS